MTCGETVARTARTSSLSTNDTQLVHSVSSLLPSHSVIPPRVPTLRREEATLWSQAEQAGHASDNDTHTQPFRAELPMGCEEDSSPRSGGRGSSVARFHDSRIKTRGCTAVFRASLRMAEFDPLGRSPKTHERGAVGQSNVTHLSVHGCFSVGLRRNMRVSRSGRCLAAPP